MNAILGVSLSAPTLARVTGVSRVAIGAVLLAAPVASVKALGVDAGTAKRAAFLTRMAAARDLGLGVGTLVAGPAAGPWLAVAAAADAVDAVVIAGAMRHGTTRGIPAATVALGAAVSAGVGLWAAADLLRRR